MALSLSAAPGLPPPSSGAHDEGEIDEHSFVLGYARIGAVTKVTTKNRSSRWRWRLLGRAGAANTNRKTSSPSQAAKMRLWVPSGNSAVVLRGSSKAGEHIRDPRTLLGRAPTSSPSSSALARSIRCCNGCTVPDGTGPDGGAIEDHTDPQSRYVQNANFGYRIAPADELQSEIFKRVWASRRYRIRCWVWFHWQSWAKDLWNFIKWPLAVLALLAGPAYYAYRLFDALSAMGGV